MTDFEKDFVKYLNLYLDGRLNEKEAIAFEKYLLDNPDKAKELEAYKTLDVTAKGEKLPDLPEGYWDGIRSRINSRISRLESRKSGWQRFRAFARGEIFSFHRGIRYAAAIISVALVILISRHFVNEMSPEDFYKAQRMERRASEPEPAPMEKMLPIPEDTARQQVIPPKAQVYPQIGQIGRDTFPTVEQMEMEAEKSEISYSPYDILEQPTQLNEAAKDMEEQERQDIKLGFDAEYGDAKSGLVNKQPKTDDISLGAKQLAGTSMEEQIPAEQAVDKKADTSIKTKDRLGKKIALPIEEGVDTDLPPKEEKASIATMESIQAGDLSEAAELEKAPGPEKESAYPAGDKDLPDSADTVKVVRLDRLEAIDLSSNEPGTSRFGLPDSLASKLSDTGDYRYGEDEIELWHYQDSELALHDFPVLDLAEYSFTAKPYKSASEEALTLNEAKEKAMSDGQVDIMNLRHEGNQLLLKYDGETEPGAKAELLLKIVNQYLQISRQSHLKSDIDKCQKLLRMASGIGLISFQEFEAYTDSLNMIQKNK